MNLLTVDYERAEELTGVSRFTLRKYAKTGRLRVVRVGRRVVVPMSELERMFAPGAISDLKKQPAFLSSDQARPKGRNDAG